MLQIKTFDYSDPDWKSHICEEYLNGNMVVIKNYKPEQIDIQTIEELASIDFRSETGEISKPLADNPLFNEAIKSAKGLDFQKKAIDEMAKLDSHVARDVFIGLLKTELQGKNFVKLDSFTTWRFTEMKDMDYHSDIYKGTTLRCFYNLSESKRHWRLGHNTYDIYKHLSTQKQQQVNEFLNSSRRIGYICAQTHAEVVGQREVNLILNELTETKAVEPLFDWKFDKHDLWIIDGRKAVHQPVWGDKLVAFDYSFLGKNLYSIKDSYLCYPKWLAEKIQSQ